MNNSGKKMSREDFAPALETTVSSMIDKGEIIRNGFKTCGLFPFSPDNVNFKKCFKSGVNEPREIEINDVLKQRYSDNFFIPLEGHEFELLSAYNSTSKEMESPIVITVPQHAYENSPTKIVNQTNTNLTNAVNPIDHLAPPLSSNSKLQLKVSLARMKFQHYSKKCLFWSPKQSVKSAKTKLKEKVPSVASSEQWREYHKKKEEEKDKKEKEKERRKEEREKKSIENKAKKKLRRGMFYQKLTQKKKM